MDVTISGGPRCGSVRIPASKSCAHRVLICAALSHDACALECDGISKDISATAKCLSALGCEISVSDDKNITVTPSGVIPDGLCHLFCGESGSTLRFLLPVVGALGAKAVFHMEGKLPTRPMDALRDALCAHGAVIRQEDDLLYCSGRLTPGHYSIPGNISSQYVSGLLFALPLLDGDSELEVTGKIESADYIAMTEDAIRSAGIVFEKTGSTYRIPGGQTYRVPPRGVIEEDWSNAAFFLCIGALSPAGVTVGHLPLQSRQGDRAILDILRAFGAEVNISGESVTVRRGKLTGTSVDASAIPDLVPTISAVAACAEGQTRIFGAARLRFKESDRLMTTTQMLTALGADVTETEDGLIIRGREKLSGGCADAANDHRIAMAAAVAACACTSPVTVTDAGCVAKSYPAFWDHFSALSAE